MRYGNKKYSLCYINYRASPNPIAMMEFNKNELPEARKCLKELNQNYPNTRHFIVDNYKKKK